LVLIGSLVIVNMIIRSMVIKPLLNLTKSAANVDIKAESQLFGMDRQDEIGDLSRTIFNAQEEIKQMHEEHQKLEIAEEKNKAKSEFLARMSHEIRTPISAVLGISEIGLQTPNIQPLVEQSFTKIYNSGKLLLGIINDILDFSKIEGGKMTIAHEEYEIASLINNAANLHYAYVGDKNIKFNLHVDENLPVFLVGDTLRIEQVIINILSNAFKYTDEGSVDLSLACKNTSENQTTLVISIKDTGLGMSQEQLKVIFDDYVRFHEREKSGVGGTGLGMSIVSNLIEMMDAKIEMESEVGKGTTVTISIPQEVTSPEVLGKDSAVRLQQYEVTLDQTAKKRRFTPDHMPYGSILVVDDIDANLYVAQGLLGFYGLNIETCTSGYDAVERVKGGKVYDIVFMDHMMPGISGPDAMLKMRELGYSHPIVILTANALAGQEAEYIEQGFDSFLSKPIMTDKLDSVLVKYVKDKQPPEVIEAAEKAGREKTDSVVGVENFHDNIYVLGRLRADFVYNHSDSITNIKDAISRGDIETAHLLAHTLKGLSGLLRENALSAAAQALEMHLSKGNIPPEADFVNVTTELTKAIINIGEVEEKGIAQAKGLDREKMLHLLDELLTQLEQRRSESINLLKDLKAIPEAAILVSQVEKLDFRAATHSVNTLRAIL